MKTLEILLVEDNPHDVVFISNALKQTSLQSKLSVVTNGDECIKYVTKQSPYEKVVSPDIIILDINMPVMDGIEVLKKIKFDPTMKTIPIVMLTSSHDKQDITEAYSNYANSYVIKPINAKSFMDTIREIEKFWVLISETP